VRIRKGRSETGGRMGQLKDSGNKEVLGGLIWSVSRVRRGKDSR
jgi:hypothetical protein